MIREQQPALAERRYNLAGRALRARPMLMMMERARTPNSESFRERAPMAIASGRFREHRARPTRFQNSALPRTRWVKVHRVSRGTTPRRANDVWTESRQPNAVHGARMKITRRSQPASRPVAFSRFFV
jgi:hypothetical protein